MITMLFKEYGVKTQYRKSEITIPRKGIAIPTFMFL
jgi:hypothetical protein